MPLLIQAYGANIVVDGSPPAEVAPALRSSLPLPVALSETRVAGAVDARFTVSRDTAGMFELRHDGSVVERMDGNESLLRSLRARVEGTIARFARTGTFIHAGAVGWRSRAILLPGISHAGKSTLVAELVRCGAVYFSDEYAILDDDGRVHAYPRPINLRQTGVELRPPHSKEPLEVALIVATAYQRNATWAPAIRRGAAAVLPILDNVIAVADRPEIALRVAARLARRAVTLQGKRPEALQVAPAVLGFLDDLLDGQVLGSDEPRRAVAPTRS